ncbi:MAG: DUF2851 family protein [Chloroflexi bacterium]|nr:DUF2851 family protein [Chloroflexota bacterium]
MTNLTESEVVSLWQSLLFQPGLTAEEGEAIRIVYPGRPNDERGGDFCGAVVRSDRQLSRGNIEVHVRSGDWQAHRHHLDAAYNQVILHVAMWGSGGVTTLADGKKVPTLALYRYLEGSEHRVRLPCAGVLERLSPPVLAAQLEAAGMSRFRDKAAAFRAMLRQKAAGQCLYEGIMTALGYTRNCQSFQRLAEQLPLEVLEAAGKERIADEDYLAGQQALLLGSAGFLCSAGPLCPKSGPAPSWAARLAEAWTSCWRKAVLSVSDWQLCKVRPGNSPVRRLVALSYLLHRYRQSGLLAGLVNLVASAQDASRLVSGLVVAADRHWTGDPGFGPGGQRPAPALLGRGRAGDIISNVLLPFAYAWGQLGRRASLARQALGLYDSYPRLDENAIERHMKRQLGLDNRLVGTACPQQGLLHLYHTRCTQGKCRGCPLSGDTSRQ